MLIVRGSNETNARAVALSYVVATHEFAPTVILILVFSCAFIVNREMKYNEIENIVRYIFFK